MDSLPRPIPYLSFASLGVSTIVCAIAMTGLSLAASPLLWSIPVSFAATLPYHITILTLARVEPHGSSRLFSRFKIVWVFAVSTLWTISTCLAVVSVILKERNLFPKYDMRVGIWLMETCAALALTESLLSWANAILCWKERKRITRAAKWTPIVINRSWSMNRK
ncbi:hypothetical protein BDP27DRAFT_1446175 [Rhodocollybia butyracea]|uniref:Uncharacterized protein n=1 Tax=Rhodocollybia butyracea TaxID=206335 RepID=A0A9P5PXF3_9AGAR|nr:hypothetical protein BDP27DRAFT_1446175 [Rhodocollybia butyracea]